MSPRVLLLFAATMLGAMSWAPAMADDEKSRLIQFEQFAGEPVEEIQFWQLTGFEALDGGTLAVWTGVDRVYLITVQEPCQRLQFANGIGLDHAMSHVISTRFDAVTFGNQRCRIDTIRPVDYEAMEDAEDAQEASGST